jgi:hypothetical protein
MYYGWNYYSDHMIMIVRPQEKAYGFVSSGGNLQTFTWGSKKVSWYNSNAGSGLEQANHSSMTYYYVAVGI